MSSVPTLPPELWAMIVELVIEDSVNLHKTCDYSNFLPLCQHLRSPKQYPPIYNLWSDIRLVSQAFKVLAGPSPYFFTKIYDVTVPRSAKAVYITLGPNGLSRLLNGKCNTHQIVSLDTANGFIRSSDDEASSGFLRYAAVLPNLRSLTLHLLTSPNEMAFWGRLNDAFPSLRCLVLTGGIRAAVEDVVVFKKLEILDIDCQLPPTGVHFPVLRHASLKSYQDQVTQWHGLESLLLRGMTTDVGLDWTQFPNLRLLGIPTSHLWILTQCPRDHPFSKLCVYITHRVDFGFVETIVERLNFWAAPKIRIRIPSKNVTPWELRIIADGCDFPGLEMVGVPHHRLQQEVYLFRSLKGISFVMLLLSIVVWDLLN